MERSARSRSKKESKGRSKSPKVPIQTYRWEDVRRARRKGGYPWTHLYKGPFNEQVDAQLFTMDHYRRTKSSSPMSGVEIQEVSTNESEISQTPANLSVDISEPSELESQKMPRASSFVIEELPDEDTPDKMKNSNHHPDEVQSIKETLTLSKESCIESMGSADSISQYLDKEERVSTVNNGNSNKDETESEKPVNGKERAKSEEATPRKRKMSAESSYSRISLSKLAVMKRLRAAKNKVKIPKISFPTKRGTKKKQSPPKETTEKTTKEIKEPTRKLKDVKPVYIHIPLKPPPGETDEFSNLENASISNEKNEETSKINKENENTITLTDPSNDKQAKIELKNISKKPPIKINPAFKKLLKDVRQLKEKEDRENRTIDEENLDTINKTKDGNELNSSETKKPNDSKPKVVDATLKTDSKTGKGKDLDKQMGVSEQNDDSEMELDLREQEMDDQDFDKLFETKKGGVTSASTPSTSRNVRSKSVEPPQRKRKSSIESSYSRKSLSKLAIMKKLNQAKEKIKSTLSLSNLFRKDSKQKQEMKTKSEKDKTKKEHKPKLGQVVDLTKKDPPKDIKPVYIHIPLKPPEGKIDEFSHLEFEPKKEENEPPGNTKLNEQPDTTASVPEEPPSVGTPDSLPVANDIQMIFLTPPSDDETLDEKTPEIPETPSSDDVKFFSGKIGELKMLAQHVVDEISPDSKKHVLEIVPEENPSDRSSVNEELEKESQEKIPDEAVKSKEEFDSAQSEEISKVISEDKDTSEQMLVDEEDGLNEPTSKRDELKSSIKSGEVPASPLMKKKVSFKRKTKVIKDTGEYEDIQPPKTEIQLTADSESDKSKIKIGETEFLTQSMSVDEEKTYLDQKIIKDTSLEEDYNKWSKKE